MLSNRDCGHRKQQTDKQTDDVADKPDNSQQQAIVRQVKPQQIAGNEAGDGDKNGDAFGVVPQFAKRVGSKDIGFGMPGRTDEKVWFDLETKAGIEGRMYTHQSVFTEQMGVNIMWTGIKNKAL